MVQKIVIYIGLFLSVLGTSGQQFEYITYQSCTGKLKKNINIASSYSHDATAHYEGEGNVFSDLPYTSQAGFSQKNPYNAFPNAFGFPATASIRLIGHFTDTNIFYVSSGAFISENHIVTAAHAVFMTHTKHFPDSMEIITVLIDKKTGKPFIYRTGDFKIHLPANYFNNHQLKSYDIAVIELNDAVGSKTGWYGYADDNDSCHNDNTLFYHFSFPCSESDNGSEIQKLSYGKFTNILPDWLGNGITAQPGESGSVFFRNINNNIEAHGIRTYSQVGFNRFDKDEISWFNEITGRYSEIPINKTLAKDDNNQKKIQKVISQQSLFPEKRVNSSERSLFVVFPNPVSDYLTLKYPVATDGRFTVRLIDQTGKLVKEEKSDVSSVNRYHTIDVNGLPSGYYVLFTTDYNISFQQKILIR
ncbi:MAG: T9SS type A sorting domain-containing protein [Bacteroidales bacterium]|nr:T9SS type A sorting domain-containing protein [Bacteroidales bacterium]